MPLKSGNKHSIFLLNKSFYKKPIFSEQLRLHDDHIYLCTYILFAASAKKAIIHKVRAERKKHEKNMFHFNGLDGRMLFIALSA